MIIEGINFTANELLILKGARDNEYSDAFEDGYPWTFAVIQTSGLDPKIARGVISSLEKKGIAAIDEYDKKDTVFLIIDEMKSIARKALEVAEEQGLLTKVEPTTEELLSGLDGDLRSEIEELLRQTK